LFVTGRIKHLNERFFGFIKPDDGSPDVFFHASALVDLVFDDKLAGQAVEFDVEKTAKGIAAVNVRPAQ
jgi:CspA family cold shock protein